MHCYTIIIHWILPPLTGTHKWNSTVSNLWTWVMASIYAQFIYLLPFSLLIYLFLCGSSPLFLRLCSLGYNVSDKHFPPRTNRLSDATSSVKLYYRAFWRNAVAQKLKRTHIFASTPLSPTHSPCFQRIQFLPLLPTAEKQENFFSETLLKSIFWHPKVFYFSIPLSQRTFNHTLPCSVIYCTVCVYGESEGRSVTVMWAVSESQENKKRAHHYTQALCRSITKNKMTLIALSSLQRHNWVFRGKFLRT